MDDNDVSTCLHCYMLKQFSHIHILRLLTADMPCWPRPACEVLNAVHNVVNCRESEYGLNEFSSLYHTSFAHQMIPPSRGR
eukprot:scaffold6063_cov191-Skeletonema_marinoi.AAC.9